ncbi:L-asparaginase [Escherichia coli]|nr:L-asparaginase [Enterobacter kobei]OZP05793.1 L-asparaginase [Escherichia coli]
MLFAILVLGSAHKPHVLRVRFGCCALSVPKLAATIYAYWDRLLLWKQA